MIINFKITLALLGLFLFCGESPISPSARLSPKPDLRFENLQAQYSNLSDLQPGIRNLGTNSIFLCSLHPQAAPRLCRFNPDQNIWEKGEWPRLCTSVSGVLNPIEAGPGQSIKLKAGWRYSLDDENTPTVFVTDKEKNRPLNGKYKLLLQYSEEPWSYINTPKRLFTVESPVFEVKIENTSFAHEN